MSQPSSRSSSVPNPNFPISLAFEQKPPLRDTEIEGRGLTPTYYLAWRLEMEDYDYQTDTVDSDEFRERWLQAIQGTRRARSMTIAPFVSSILHADPQDSSVYFIVATNTRDPGSFKEDDIEYAQRALPKIHPHRRVELDAVFRWYKLYIP
ncbi:hypothetical protein MKEN_00145100 [Mycena kentingensis (nom. inval.)]|nr:hypothetical protein MKEN_00145100 [Mycena kentingensis (nom. inval.)]